VTLHITKKSLVFLIIFSLIFSLFGCSTQKKKNSWNEIITILELNNIPYDDSTDWFLEFLNDYTDLNESLYPNKVISAGKDEYAEELYVYLFDSKEHLDDFYSAFSNTEYGEEWIFGSIIVKDVNIMYLISDEALYDYEDLFGF
jgi:hypothetical protein